MTSSIRFDWTRGKAFVQDGTIFYSPNCARMVLIPSQPTTSSPFNVPRLDISLFNQPTWWTDVYGWQCFIPLAPSYTSSPFEPFCWMPRIIEVETFGDIRSSSGLRERRFQMHPEDFYIWNERERLLTEAAEHIRIWYKIPGNLPPPPSKFNYGRPHKSLGVAKKMIRLARDWLVVWMGFISYQIAASKRFVPSSSSAYNRPDQNSPFPVWYQRLEETHKYPVAWLDGLTASNVCSFQSNNPRAGVVFEWSKADKTRPDLNWFIEHDIPIWFVWSKEEERAIERDRSLSFLKPPNELIQDAITRLFDNPSTRIPLAGLIINRYYHMGSNPPSNESINLLKIKEAPSFVLNYTTQVFLGEADDLARTDEQEDDALKEVLMTKRYQQKATARADANFPTQTMIEAVEKKGKLYNHWQDFMDRRDLRQSEMIKVESAIDRQRRLSREMKPGIKNVDMYTWEKIRSSGGKEVYMRLRVNKKHNEDVFSSYRSHQRIFNSLANEWDLCREFRSDKRSGQSNTISDSFDENFDLTDDDSASEDGSEWYPNDYEEVLAKNLQETSTTVRPLSPPRTILPCASVGNSSSRKSPTPPYESDIELTDPNSSVRLYSVDVVETLHLGYGYIPAILSDSITEPISPKEWETVLMSFGFESPSSVLEVEEHEKRTVYDFFNNLVKKYTLSPSLDDLNSGSHLALRHLFDFSAIHRPSSDLFVFSAPRSSACDWLLGVNSPEVALYVCRYIISNPGAHTIVTVANRLLQRGVPFRTLLGMDSSYRQMYLSEPYIPPSFRFSNHIFSPQDFEASMLRCQSILSQPQGRAALLKGGIIWRIAKEFLSGDSVLDGPSVEVTAHRVGYMHASGTAKVNYCDDDLTENEIAVICGTYSLFTQLGQVTVKSWFPPPVCWTKDRTGVQWIEWTARNEQFFRDLMRDIRNGKSIPLTVVEWTSRLRGWKLARIIRDNNRKRTDDFLEEMVPSPIAS